ncbi:MAG: GGDEF domain-containing protein [Gammaproteobacteria bacterium]|nr:GGDEF domain-containing protein [Gammaproteobacteria bacterium]
MQLNAIWDVMDDGGAMTNDVPEVPESPRRAVVGNDDLLRLTQTLQTTLNVQRLLELFTQECAKVIPFDGLGFVNEADGMQLLIGTTARHSCGYRLSLETECLGEITFSRAIPFTTRETMALDFLGSHLLYPLRNAQLYQRALLVAAKDPLTGAFNRATLEQSLHRDTSLAKRHGTPFSVIMLDLDHFKDINDRHGHMTGDCVLKSAARLFQECVRDSDTLFRFGGEEFTILLSNSDREGARQLAERIRGLLAGRTIHCDGHDIQITVSAGVAQWSGDESPDRVLLRADQALYAAKDQSRNRVALAP